MKHIALPIFICSICLFLLYSCGPDKTEVIQNYSNGEISKRYNTIDGKKEGLMTDYYADGSIKLERMFRNDTQVGRTIVYYKSGKIQEVQYYEKGIREGADSTFYEDGQPYKIVTYDNGIKHGYVRTWGRDGSLIYEARFERDSLVEVTVKPVPADTLQKNKK